MSRRKLGGSRRESCESVGAVSSLSSEISRLQSKVDWSTFCKVFVLPGTPLVSPK